jgi:serine/threonine protein kinase
MAQPAASPNFAGERSEIGGYPVVRTLAADASWLVTAAGGAGRTLVLKTLDEDCIWKGQLHPNVRDRLARVRELAHSGVANLYGVERDAGLTYLVWDFVFGETLEDAATAKTQSQRDFLRLARDLVLAVETLHARGIVHGSLKPSNVIVTADGRVVLTHISPLLYSDPADDVEAVVLLLGGLAERRGESDSPLARMLADVDGREITPRRLATRIAALIDARETAGPGAVEADRSVAQRVRRRAMIGATATGVLSLVLFVGMRQYANANTPKPPTPPQAGREALQPRGEAPSAAISPWKRP